MLTEIEKKQMRADLGPLYDICDSILVVEEKKHEELDEVKKKAKKIDAQFINAISARFIQVIKKKIEESTDKEHTYDMYINALCSTVISMIKFYVDKDDWKKMSENIHREFKRLLSQ